MISRFLAASFVSGAFLIGPQAPCQAADPTIAAEICNSAGVCTPTDPVTMIVIIGLAQIAKELSKDDPFGKNNEIVKAINTIVNDAKNGMGPNNDLVVLFRNAGRDLTCGPGQNNEIIKFLNSLGLRIKVSGC